MLEIFKNFDLVEKVELEKRRKKKEIDWIGFSNITIGFIRRVVLEILSLKNLLEMFPMATSCLAFWVLLIHLHPLEAQMCW